ncbi:MAG: hypothetical protein HeimC3_32240 [Candidatus Heimdallarchaeota archaeon LC_3]|nr:MAG: hypothetical protein HeimC3_32240 [Candidatus Heimdallarchaeota archaeon LC_3]
MGFTITDLPSDAVITDAKLEISVKTMPSDDASVQMEVFETTSFDENTLTGTNSPSFDKGVSSGLITADSVWAFTFVGHSVAGNGDYFLALQTFTENIWWITFDGRNNWLNPPTLTVTYDSSTPQTTTTYNNINYPVGAVSFSTRIEDKEKFEKTVNLINGEKITIYFTVSASEVDVEFFYEDKSVKVEKGISSEYTYSFNAKRIGPFKIIIENPGLFDGGDPIDIEGYYILGKADFGEITEPTTTYGFDLLFMLSALTLLLLKRRKK